MHKANLEFRKIPSLLFLYEVNEDGTIIRNARSKRALKCRKHSHNSHTEYWCLNVNLKGKIRKVYTHKVVAECWLGQKPEGYEIDHIDRNSLNNHYSNLRYVTKSEQMKNRAHSGISKIGSANLDTARRLRMRPVALVNDDFRLDFESQSAAARWFATKTNKTVEHIRAKFKKRRAHVYGYDVIYLNGETERVRPTGQVTVH